MPRHVHKRYDDPLELVWLACARELGLTVARSGEVYASYDGEGTLTLTAREHFDADDSLAQLVFHELCHALIAGPRALALRDWGMENVDDRDLLVEHACHRLQAALADRYGLRGLLAVTTDHRSYWDALPVDTLAAGDDPAIPLARDAFERATSGPWASALHRALTRTASIAGLVRELSPGAHSVWADTRELHAAGFPLGDDPALRCGACAWSFKDGAALRCRKTRGKTPRGVRVSAEARACVRFEAHLDERECARCGACCREGFDRVDVRAKDLIKKQHPELVSTDGYGAHLARPRGLCVALTGDGGQQAPYRCRVYAARPSACADFAIAGDACLEARRRVGLSS